MKVRSRRSLLKTMLAAGIAPSFVPAHVLRAQSAPSNKITLGVIGVGAQGTGDMRAFLNHDDVRVTAVCDVNTRNIERARKLIAERYGSDDVKVYRDFRELNRDASIDAVLMALPVHWHSIPAADAILNGKHIYHEKPMGMSFEEAKRVRAAVRKKGVVFQFGTQQRSDLKFRWASELALNGRLGKLKEIQVGVPGGKTTAAVAGAAGAGFCGLGALGRSRANDSVQRAETAARQSREHHQLLARHDLLLGHPSSRHRAVGQRHGRDRAGERRGHGDLSAKAARATRCWAGTCAWSSRRPRRSSS